MVEFNFIEEDDDNARDTEDEIEDDEDFIDLSDILGSGKEEDENESSGDSGGMGRARGRAKEVRTAEVAGLEFSFEDSVPQARSIADPEVREKARTRKRRTSKKDYRGKCEDGWSLYCAHPSHLPSLCERAQNAGEVTCTCSCHERRGFVLTEPESLSGSEDEEFVFILN